MQDGTGSIIIGAEGHRSAIERAEKDLAALYGRVALQPGDAVSHAIEQKEAHLAKLRNAAQAIAAVHPGDLRTGAGATTGRARAAAGASAA